MAKKPTHKPRPSKFSFLSLYSQAGGSSIFLHPGEFLATWASLDATTVVPGQPIPITWNLHSLWAAGLAPGTVTARVYLDEFNAKLFESQPVQLVPTQFG